MIWTVNFAAALFMAFVCYRIARILGHWEYGVLGFFVLGYLYNISEYLSSIFKSMKKTFV